jgi:hypothetical protein
VGADIAILCFSKFLCFFLSYKSNKPTILSERVRMGCREQKTWPNALGCPFFVSADPISAQLRDGFASMRTCVMSSFVLPLSS